MTNTKKSLLSLQEKLIIGLQKTYQKLIEYKSKEIENWLFAKKIRL